MTWAGKADSVTDGCNPASDRPRAGIGYGGIVGRSLLGRDRSVAGIGGPAARRVAPGLGVGRHAAALRRGRRGGVPLVGRGGGGAVLSAGLAALAAALAGGGGR